MRTPEEPPVKVRINAKILIEKKEGGWLTHLAKDGIVLRSTVVDRTRWQDAVVELIGDVDTSDNGAVVSYSTSTARQSVLPAIEVENMRAVRNMVNGASLKEMIVKLCESHEELRAQLLQADRDYNEATR